MGTIKRSLATGSSGLGNVIRFAPFSLLGFRESVCDAEGTIRSS